MQPDFTTCLVFNTRMAARAVTRRYDAVLRPHNLTAAQFALLGSMSPTLGQNVTELAEHNGIERTSLTRNLDRLERRGLIASEAAGSGNGRLCRLTPEGEAMLEMLTPLWQQAQDEMQARLTADGFARTLGVLRRLADVPVAD